MNAIELVPDDVRALWAKLLLLIIGTYAALRISGLLVFFRMIVMVSLLCS